MPGDQPIVELRPSWRFFRFLCQWAMVLLLKARCFGVHRVPARGGALLVCNHQSFFDPILVTMALTRESSYMARDSLFRNRWFKRLIEHLNAFPVRRNEADLSAIKGALRRLKRGLVLVMFPEGTRTSDGQIAAMLPGLAAVAKKARIPIVPTLIDGMYQAWPRHGPLPGPGDVVIEYGQPIYPDEYADLDPQQLMDLIRRRLIAMQQRWHSRVPRRRLEWFRPTAEAN